MPRPSILPNSGVLASLRRPHRRPVQESIKRERVKVVLGWEHPDGCKTGHTLQQIADMYGVSVNGVYRALRKATLTKARPRYDDTLPWVVSGEHAQDWPAHMLRELSKRQAGLPAGQRGPWLDGWLAELDQSPRRVVDYSPETGFTLVRRRKSDGEGYIRQPKVKRTRKATG